MVYLRSLYPPVPELPETNFHHILFNRPDQADWADFVLYIDAITGNSLTFRQFKERVYDGATALGTPGGRLGLSAENGHIVGIISENSSDYMALVHSCLVITTPFALISSYATPYELSHGLRLAKPTHLFISAKLLKRVLPVAKEFGIPFDSIFLLGEHQFDSDKHITGFGDLINEVRNKTIPRIAVRQAKKDTIAYLVFSSGTSGLPKAVCLSHGNLLFSVGQSLVIGAETAIVEPPTPGFNVLVALGFLPLFHSYGLHAYCFRALLQPATIVMLPAWDIALALSSISKYRIAHISMIPSVVHQIVNYPKIKEADLSSVETVSCGAAYLPAELSQRMVQLVPEGKLQISEGYGMSEATIGAMFQPVPGSLGGRGKRVPGSCGLLIPGMEARILRPDGTHVEFGEPGELYLRSDNIALGYWGNQKATDEAFVTFDEDKGKGGKWLKTGDQFYVDRDGYFYFADRSKDTLKISGAQVSPLEIEEAVMEEPSKLIIDITVAGVSGGRTSDEKVPKAWVVLSQRGKERGVEDVVRTLNAWVGMRLSKYKALRGGIEVVDEIPKLPTGKVLRRLLQEKHEEAVKNQEKSRL